MPELPEVETIRRGLNKFILKRKITKVDIFCDKSFIGDTKIIQGRTITSIQRYGKALVLNLDNGISIMIHLRMTGQLIYDPSTKTNSSTRFAAGHPSDNFIDHLPNKQTRIILHLTTGTLYFNDQRKFGFFKVLPTNEIFKDPFIQKLAKEPWAMTPKELHLKFQRHKNSLVKAALLDQTIICGLGNIYADEALFAAQIHPERRAGTLSLTEVTKLLESACNVMDKSIASGGSTMSTYVKADGNKGDYLELFAQVFHKENQPCPRCNTKIIKLKIAGRGTHICPHCQRLSPDISACQNSAFTEVAHD